MKVAAIVGPEQSAIQNQPTPFARGAFVVVKVLVVPMCTEYQNFRNGKPNACLGHEAAGEVVEVDGSSRVRPGDRVVVMPQYPCGHCNLCSAGDYIHCQHNQDPLAATGNEAGTATFAQYLIKQDWLLLPAPDGMSLEHASMACCGMGPTFGAMERMAVDAFDTVLITGMGPVGLGGVINARQRGAKVIAVESHPYRADLARRLGVAAVIDPRATDAADQVRALTGGVGVDKAIETSGVPAAKSLLLNAVRRRGEAAFVGWKGTVEVDTVISKGLTIHGAWHWNLRLADRMMAAIAQSGPQIDMLITHRFPMSRVQEAWELQCTGNCGKVLLDPWS